MNGGNLLAEPTHHLRGAHSLAAAYSDVRGRPLAPADHSSLGARFRGARCAVLGALKVSLGMPSSDADWSTQASTAVGALGWS